MRLQTAVLLVLIAVLQGLASTAAVVVLEPGVWPISEEQRRCIVASADSSEAWGQFEAVAALLGAAIMDSSNATQALLATPAVQAVLDQPLGNITRSVEAWVAEVVGACGIPDLELQGIDNSNSTGVQVGMIAWLSTVDEADVLGFFPLPDNATDEEVLAWAEDQFGPLVHSSSAFSFSAPDFPGRRLLYAAGLIEDEEVAVGLSYALGISTGLASGAVTSGYKALGVVLGAAGSVWKAAGNTFGLTSGTLLAMDQQVRLDENMAALFALVSDDVSVEQAFLSGQTLGGLLSAPDLGSLDRRVRGVWPLVKTLFRTVKSAGRASWRDLQEIIRLLRAPSVDPNNLRAVLKRWMRSMQPAFRKGTEFYELQDAVKNELADIAGQAFFVYNLAACDKCSDGDSSPAITIADSTPYFSTPCTQEKFKIGDLSKCYPLSLTGRRSGSICAEANCFVEALEKDASGRYAMFWLMDHQCGQDGTSLGLPRDAGCAVPPSVPSADVIHCDSMNCPACAGHNGSLCTGVPLSFTEGDSALGICSKYEPSYCTSCFHSDTELDPCPTGYKCLSRRDYPACFPNDFQIPPPDADGVVRCSENECPGCYGPEQRLCIGYPLDITEPSGIGLCGVIGSLCMPCSVSDPCLDGYKCVEGNDYNVCVE